MNPDETNETPDATPNEPREASGDPGVEAILKANIGRRTFLAAAALGAAAAGFLNKSGEGLSGLGLGPLSAFADGDTSNFGCEAQDVRLVGDLQVVGEPCDCSVGARETVVAQAVVTNNANSTRYCITAHLPAQTITVGTVVATVGGGDILLASSLTGNATTTVNVTVTNWLCGAGRVCFGNPTPVGQNGKTDCPTAPCAAISWQVPSDKNLNCSTLTHADIQKSKCHWQQICIVGRGAEFTCLDGCTPQCGGTSTLKVCASGGGATKKFVLGTQTQTVSSTGTACATFSVTTTATTTYTATVDFGETPACVKTLTTVISASPLPSFSPTVTGPDCAGLATICASVSGATSYVFSETGAAFATATTTPGCATRTYTPTTAAQTHTVSVVASNGGCSTTGLATVTVNPEVGTLALTPSGPDCSGAVTLSASATGASTLSFLEGATTLTSTANPGSFSGTLSAGTHTIVVVARDGQTGVTCSSTAAATFTINPALAISISATAPTGCTSLSGSNVPFSATPSGGSGTYTIGWTVDGSSAGSGTAFTYTANPDALTHTVGASVTDGFCTATATPMTVSQCVSTTIG
jgi:hypothetical protein